MKTTFMSRFLKVAYLSAVYLFLYAPIFVLIAYSFNDSTYSLVWQKFTWKWYEALVENAELHMVAYHSLLARLRFGPPCSCFINSSTATSS